MSVGLPGIAMNVQMCWDCRQAGAIPLDVLVSRTALMGGTNNATTWWYELIHDTVARVGITCEDFEALVATAMGRSQGPEVP